MSAISKFYLDELYAKKHAIELGILNSKKPAEMPNDCAAKIKAAMLESMRDNLKMVDELISVYLEAHCK